MKKIIIMLLALLTISSMAFAEIKFQELSPEYMDYLYKLELQKFGVKNLNSLAEIQPKYDFITTFPEYGVAPEPFAITDDLVGAEGEEEEESKFPAAYSAKDEGMVTGIRSQNPWGTCWAHGATASAEHSFLANERFLPESINFSELDAAWRANYFYISGYGTTFNTDYESATYEDREGVLNSGGSPSSVATYYFNYLGPISEKDCPYVSPYFIKNDRPNVAAGVIATATMYSSTFEGREAIKEYITKYGGMAISYSSSGCEGSSVVKNGHWTYYCPEELLIGSSGHCVCVVGWDDEFSADNFGINPKDYIAEGEDEKGAWLIKNSGGNYGPENGYMWISYHQSLWGNSFLGLIVGGNQHKYAFSIPDQVSHLTNGFITPCNATGLSTTETATKNGFIEGFIVSSSTAGKDVKVKITVNGKSYTASSDSDYKKYNGIRTGFLKTHIQFKKGDVIEATLVTDSNAEYPTSAIPIEPVANKYFAKNQEGQWEDIGVNGWSGGLKLLCSEYKSVESIEVPVETLDLTKGEEYVLVAKALPEDASNKTLKYSSNKTSVASVEYDEENENYVLTAKKAGQAIITVSSDDLDSEGEKIQSQITVNVWNPVTSISGVESKYTLYKGIKGYDKVTLSPVASPSSTLQKFDFTPLSNSLKITPSEDSKTAIVEIADNLGQDFGKNNSVRVTAKIKNTNLKNVNKVSNFNIVIPVTGLSLVSSKTVNLGDKVKLTAQISPKTATNQTVTWKSNNEDIATVDKEGNVTTKTYTETPVEIKATITDKYYDGDLHYEKTFTKVCKLTVVSKPSSIKLCSDKELEEELPSNISLNLGQKYKVYPKLMNGTFGDEYIQPQYKQVTYTSSNRSILSVTSNGEITALRTGKAYITAKTKTNSKTFKLNITVKNYPVKAIALDETTLVLNVSDYYKLGYKITPENAVNQIVTWSSSKPSVASVDDNGLVTGIGAGTANITVTTDDGGYKATCNVTVIKVPVYYVDLYKFVRDLGVGKTSQFKATAYSKDSGIQPSVTNITWSSSDTSVATVSTSGLVKAVGKGSCYIKATCDDKSTSVKLTVYNEYTPVEKITLNKTSLSSNIGNTYKLVATVLPKKATNRDVAWKTGNSKVATVDEEGNVTIVGYGNTYIRATTYGKNISGKTIYADCKVTVEKIPVETIKLNKTNLNLKVGKSAKLIATVGPSKAYEKGVKWKTGNSKIATVDSNGNVTIVGSGTTYIRATTKGKNASNKTIYANCTITATK